MESAQLNMQQMNRLRMIICMVLTIQIIIRSLFICCIFSCADSIRALSTYIILNICDLSGTYFESADAPPGAPQKRLPH